VSWRKTYNGAEPQRVNKWLASEGVCSRREAEDLIARGLVSINGARVDDPGRKIEPGQTLEVGESNAKPQISVMINKPVGVVSAQPEGDQVPAARLLTRANLVRAAETMPTSRTSLAPLGRLDQDSRGLLVLSEDGVLAKAFIGEHSKLDKEYLVRVAGTISEQKLALLRQGRNRQIRRMCELVDLDVTDLLRIRIGPLKLGDLQESKWRTLTRQERDTLIAASK